MAESRDKTDTPIGPLPLAALGRAFAAIREDSGDDAPQGAPQAPRLDGYTLTERLGEGGGGVVYKGYREGSDRALAIKLIRQHDRQQDQGSRRAWRELELLMQIRLPAVPRVIDYGWSGGRLYIASEFVDGLALDRHCQSAGLDRRARVELLARVADAVQSLHEQGVIHRDIKPSNVLIDKSGHPMIIDLGIATLLAPDVMATLTAEGVPIGSPAFMAPEQARGERERISTRTDVYGLGATGFLVLTGTTPHDTRTTIHEAVRRVAQDPARRAREVEPSLPRGLAAVLDKAVSARPEDRYSSAAAMAADLRRWLGGAPVLAGKAGVWVRSVGWIARHPVAATTALCAVDAALVFCGTVLSTWWLSFRPHHLRKSSDGHSVDLLSIRDGPLHTWSAGYGNVSGYELVDRPSEMGGGRIALIGIVGNEFREPGRPEGLFAYALDRPKIPLWTSGSSPPAIVMPRHPNFTAAPLFKLRMPPVVADFLGSPGPEILALHSHATWSPTVIRIYDLAGKVRYEAWHDGYIEAVQWLPEMGLLICVGVNSEVYWRGRGVDRVKDFPVVVMALRPEDSVRAGWVSTPTHPGDVESVWYRCLLPAKNVEVFQHSTMSLAPVTGSDGSQVDLYLSTIGAGYLSLRLDQTGAVISRSPSAEYGQRVGPESDYPDPDSLYLGDLPPIVPGAEMLRPANR